MNLKYRLVQGLLRLLGEPEEAFVREQNDRPAHALRRMTRENNRLETALMEGRARCRQAHTSMQASIELKKQERNYFRDQLIAYHARMTGDTPHAAEACPICQAVSSKHPFDRAVPPEVPA